MYKRHVTNCIHINKADCITNTAFRVGTKRVKVKIMVALYRNVTNNYHLTMLNDK